MDDELKEAREKAMSFPGLTPPAGSVYIGAVKMGNDTHFYYRCGEEYYWDSESGRRIKREMEAAIKRNTEKRRKMRRF